MRLVLRSQQEGPDHDRAVSPRYNKDADFACGICFDDKRKGDSHVLVAGDPVCKECFVAEIKPKFAAAIENENDYPVQWGNVELQPMDFPDSSSSLNNKWQAKVKEYTTARAQRVYCTHEVSTTESEPIAQAPPFAFETRSCGRFLGAQPVLSACHIKCQDCKGWVCGSCGSPLRQVWHPLRRWYEHHDCNPPNLSDQPREDADLGTRGVDYQRCPNDACAIPTYLSDGCNTIFCKCRTHFCFICETRAHHDSDHWSTGGCPRWNQPGSLRAHHDNHAPLVIDPAHLGTIRRIRERAANEPNEHNRQIELDHAIQWEILADVTARRVRAIQGGMAVRAWYRPLTKLLILLGLNLDPLLYTYDTVRDRGPGKSRRELLEFSLENIRRRVEVVKQGQEFLRREQPAVFDLYPQLLPLLDRHEKLTAQGIKDSVAIIATLPDEQGE